VSEDTEARTEAVEKFLNEPDPPYYALYSRVLHHYHMTPTQFALLEASEQTFMLGYEMYRAERLAEWRKALQGDDPKKSNYTAEAATMLLLEGL